MDCPSWIGPTLLLGFLVFFIGSVTFLTNKDVRMWANYLVIAFLIAAGSIILSALFILTQIPLPLVGNAFNAAAIVVGGLVFSIAYLWPGHRTGKYRIRKMY